MAPRTVIGVVRMSSSNDPEKKIRIPYLALLPVLLCLALMVVLHLTSPTHPITRMVFEPPLLLPILNSIFVFLVGCIVSYLAIRSYLSRGLPTILYFGCGMLSLGSGVFIAGWLIGPWGPNVTSTIFTLSVFLSSVFYMAGVIVNVMERPPEADLAVRRRKLVTVYPGLLALVALIALATIAGIIPPFFIRGTGPTVLRQVFVTSTLTLFIVTSSSMMILFVQKGVRFLYWYSLGLALLTINTLGAFLQPALGSPMGWVARGSLYLAGIYFLVAAVSALREARTHGLAISDAIAEVFRQSERKISFIFGNMTDCYFELDREWRFIRINDQGLAFFRRNREEFIGRLFLDVLPEDRGSIFEEQYGKALSEGIEVHFEVQSLVSPDKWAGVHAYPTEEGLSVFIRDITDRKRAEQALRQSEKRFRLALKNSPVSVAMQDRNLVYQWAYNQRTRRPDEIIGKTDADLFAPEEVTGILEAKRRVLESGFEVHVENWVTSNGRRLYLDLYYEPIRDSAGEITGIGITAVNLTEQKLAEEALCEKELFLRQGETLARVGGWKANPDTDYLVWTEGVYNIIEAPLNYRPGFTEGLKFFAPEYIPVIHDSLSQALTGGGPFTVEVEVITTTGKRLWTEVRGLVRMEEHQGTSVVGTFQDITERKQAEESLKRAHNSLELRVQERTAELSQAYEALQHEMKEREKMEGQLRQSQKMEAIGTLAGGIAHDFNNILAAILGFTEMAAEDVADRPEVERNLRNVLKSAMRARELVKQILAFSRKTSHERTPLSLSSVINETVHLLRASIPSTIEITLTNTATSDTILAAPIEIQQILMNLATNASLAMQDKGGTLEVSLTDIDFAPESPVLGPDVIPGEYLQLLVKDTGIGMTPDVMKRVFEPFFTTREVGKGTGMGLAVVYGIVKDLQGTITVESTPGVGSTFRVFLPKIKAEQKEEQPQTAQIPGGRERILFLDDEDMIVEWGEAVLERLGYQVTALTDSTEALKTFSSDPSQFDLVITDQTMPGIPGLQLSKELLKIRPDIPIILCTGHSDTVSPEMAKEAGIREFLMKPLVKQELAQVIRRVLDTKFEG